MSIYLGNTKIRQCNVVFNDGVDTNVTAGNIRKDIRILGVNGTFTATGTQSAGQDVATASDILQGCSAWVDGAEVEGTFVVNKYYVGSGEPQSSLGRNGDIYLQINS